MNWDTIAQLAVLASVLILVWQTRALKVQIARSEMQSVYDRYLEITKIEVSEPRLHRMFLYGRDFERFAHLSEDELHERALSLLIFDQFALIFNMSKRPRPLALLRYMARRFAFIGNRRWVRASLDRRRTIWEINEDYVRQVLTNPRLIRSWRDWGLGETWEGSEFHTFVEEVIDIWHAGRSPDRTAEPSTGPVVPVQRVASETEPAESVTASAPEVPGPASWTDEPDEQTNREAA